MTAFVDTGKNLSLYTIPAAWVIAIAPHFYASQLAKSAFDPRCPRDLTRSIKDDPTIPSETKERVQRAEGAQTNGFENVGLYASAVIAGNVAGLSARTLNLLSGGYLVSRLLYNWIYINNTTVKAANARTAVFLSGIGLIFTLFVKAGNVLRERGVVFSV